MAGSERIESPGEGSVVAGFAGAEPSRAERVRTLVHAERVGVLSTQSQKHAGFPFGSVAPHGVLPDGSPTFLLSSLALHTQNVAAEPRASFLVAATSAAPTAESSGALARARATLLGEVRRIEGAAEIEAARADYLARHEEARAWIGFGDFALYRLDVSAVYWVAGFGAMGWVGAEEYRVADPDPLVESAVGILAHMNADHRDALSLYGRAFADLDVAPADVEMVEVDRLGFRMRARLAGGEDRAVRIGFPRPVVSADETRRVLIEMLRDARARCSAADSR